MQRIVLTITILLAALAFYGFGMEKSSGLLLACGAGLEMWFWVRALRTQ